MANLLSGGPPTPPAGQRGATERVTGEAKDDVVLHCTSAWRASHLGAAYLIDVRHVDIETALANARLSNLDDSDPMMLGKGPQPIEEFLGRRLPTWAAEVLAGRRLCLTCLRIRRSSPVRD